MPAATPPMSPEEAVRRVAQARETLVNEVHKIIIGQDEMIEQMLICTFARGHCLTIGVPGLAKTLTVSTLAQALHLKFTRIQFTPDLMPSDITGTEIIDQDPASGKRSFRFMRGPVFSNIVLADEINRTPPKTQAALLAGDAGIRGDRGRQHVQARPAVFRDGHPEPDRAGGHLPAARGPIGPLHAVDQHRLPDAERGAGDRHGHHADGPPGAAPRAARPGYPLDPAARPAGADQPAHGRLRGRSGPGDPSQGSRRAPTS